MHYLGSKERAQPIPEEISLSQKLSNMSDADIEDFMRSAEIVSVDYIGTGITKPKRVTQQRGGVTNDAVFKYEDTHPKLEKRSSWSARRPRWSSQIRFSRYNRLCRLSIA